MVKSPERHCVRCGVSLETPLDPFQRRVLQEVQYLQRHTYVVTTRALAARLALSHSHMLRYLRDLEKQGYLTRIGKRGGWQVW